MAKRCPSCGTDNKDDKIVCYYCGAMLPEDASTNTTSPGLENGRVGWYRVDDRIWPKWVSITISVIVVIIIVLLVGAYFMATDML